MRNYRYIIFGILLAAHAVFGVTAQAQTQSQEKSQSQEMVQAKEKKVIKGFSGGMMVHAGYQFGCDNPYGLDISSPTFGIGGCAKIHLSKHFRTGFEG